MDKRDPVNNICVVSFCFEAKYLHIPKYYQPTFYLLLLHSKYSLPYILFIRGMSLPWEIFTTEVYLTKLTWNVQLRLNFT